ncbi:MAG: TetR family transcriptional regulator [Victivallaceae bacterium]|nr:TetR family transcriptional regulator [Victivallaceae bacterium]
MNIKDKKTARALIEAAGRLFSISGIDAVTTRAISLEAGGIDISLIKYYFGGKDGLIQAVAETAMRPLQEYSLEEYYRKNSSLLSTRDGQKAFVSGMIEVIFNRFDKTVPDGWRKGFLLQILQKRGMDPMRKNLIETYMKPMVAVFARVYCEVTGNDDFETALCWYLFVTAQLFLYSGDTDLVDLLHPETKVGNGFSRRLQYFCTQEVLRGFHLTDDTAKTRAESSVVSEMA